MVLSLGKIPIVSMYSTASVPGYMIVAFLPVGGLAQPQYQQLQQDV